MNLWLRLLRVLLATRFAAQLPMPGGVSILHFRVMLHDLDLAVHMNNGPLPHHHGPRPDRHDGPFRFASRRPQPPLRHRLPAPAKYASDAS